MNLSGGIPVINSRNGPGSVIGKTIGTVASRLVSFQAATVLSDHAAANKTTIGLDVSPSTPIGALSMTGRLAKGQRVMVAFYPPRGCLVLGPIDEDSDLSVRNLAVSGDFTALRARAASAFDTNVDHVVSTSFTDSGTVATLTMPYPASGIVVVTMSCRLDLDDQTGLGTEAGVLSFEIRDDNVAGTLRQAASDTYAAIGRSVDTIMGISRTVLVGGLPTTGDMFLRAMYRVNNALADGEFDDVWIVVQPSP